MRASFGPAPPPAPPVPHGMILLVDMDAFFASVEQAHHPHLRGKPVIVCGDPSRRGVVTAASYEARPFGVRAGMPLQEARRLCPQAEYVEGNPQKYVGLSLQLLDLYLTLSPDVEPFSVDEAFVGLASNVDTLDRALEIAAGLQSAIDQRFQLGASIGIGPNKLIAKMASGVRKPRGLTALDQEGFQRQFWPLPVRELWGVGPKLSESLAPLGIATVGDLAHASEPLLRQTFGVIGAQLREAANGYDQSPLVPYHRGVEPKSMGHEVTLPEDCADAEFLEGTLLRLADQVARRLRGEGYVGRTVTLKLRNHRFETITRQRVMAQFSAECPALFEVARALFRAHWNKGAVRLLGLSVSMLERGADPAQAELFAPDQRAVQLRQAMDRVRDRLGESSLVPAGSLTHRRPMGHVPFGAITPRTVERGDRSAGDRDDAPRGDSPGGPPGRPTRRRSGR
jgi:DNA polymerase-4